MIRACTITVSTICAPALLIVVIAGCGGGPEPLSLETVGGVEMVIAPADKYLNKVSKSMSYEIFDTTH